MSFPGQPNFANLIPQTPPGAAPAATPVAAPAPAFAQPQAFGPPQGFAPPQAAPQPMAAPVSQVAPQPQYPTQYGQPQPQPQYAAHAPQGSFGDRVAGVPASLGRIPQAKQGEYVGEVLKTEVRRHPIKGTETFFLEFRILQSNNPAQPPGTVAAYLEGLQFGMGRIKYAILQAAGFQTEEQALAAGVSMRDLLNSCSSEQQIPGCAYPPQMLKGRPFRLSVGPQETRAKRDGGTSTFSPHMFSVYAG